MNYLAHLALSGNNEDVLFGNFIGDDIKGKDLSMFPKQVRNGLLLHRMIDDFADTHEINLKTKKRLYPVNGKYSGVALDMIQDHLLAVNWAKFSKISLEEFVENCYSKLTLRENEMSVQMKNMFFHMKEDNWLLNYSTLDGLQKACNGLERRIRHKSGLSKVSEHLSKNFEKYNEEFLEFFPLIIEATSLKITTFTPA